MTTTQRLMRWRGGEGYEEARQAAIWNLRKPDRYPDVIVHVSGEEDVVSAVRLARERGLNVKARGGGHSWTASHVREGMLIDFASFKEIAIDPESRTATVTPSVHGMELNEALAAHGLFFPGGHCSDVGLGGFLLQGGFGWNGRALGPACASVRAIDVVTAAGELIHSTDSSNSAYVWAARGSGPGFFGVVTRFHLGLHPRPQALLLSSYVYPLELYDEVIPWFLGISSSLPREIEPLLFATEPAGAPAPVIIVTATSFAATEAEGRDALATLETCPVRRRALETRLATPTTFRELYALVDAVDAPGYRYCVDGMWTDLDLPGLGRELRDMFMTMPTPESSVLLLPWCVTDVPNGVFSMQSSLYVSPVAACKEPPDDKRCTAWATEQMRQLEPLSKGIQLADENLINRPAPFLAPEKLARLEQLRARHDPDSVFHSYLLPDQ